MSEPGSPIDVKLKPKIAINLERAKTAITVLEELFASNPTLETQSVMHRLLEVYKQCRFTDRLMNTSFFHEDNFMGLIERVRRGSTTTSTPSRVQDHKNRLFNESPCPQFNTSSRENPFFPPILSQNHLKRCGTSNSVRAKRSNLTPPIYPDINVDEADGEAAASNNSSDSLFGCIMTNIDQSAKGVMVTDDYVGVDIAAVPVIDGKSSSPSANNDSGNHTKTGEWGEASGCTSSDITTDINSTSLLKPNHHDDQTTSNSCCSIEMPNEELSEFACARLSALIKAQLIKALHEITQRFYPNSPTSDVISDEVLTVKTEQSIDGLIGVDDKTSKTTLEAANSAFEADETDVISSTFAGESVPMEVPSDCFLFLEKAPASHAFCLSIFEPTSAQQFFKAVRFDHKLLKTALPPGVWVR